MRGRFWKFSGDNQCIRNVSVFPLYSPQVP
nr:MAG TPA: hypothetical protein [Caudoviricetes sp.]